MMPALKRRLQNLYYRSPLLFRTDAFFNRIRRRIKNRGQNWNEEKREREKTTGPDDIQSLKELLRFLDSTDSKVYGREIIEDYEDNANKSILLVSHELSFSGAPIVLLNLAESLKRKGFQTIMICGLDGEKFSENAALKGIPVVYYPELQKSDMIARIRKLFVRIIVSTIRCVHVIRQLNATDSSVMWWIHEAGCCYRRGTAKEMPDRVADNIHIYSGGLYAGRLLVSRFPGYKVENLPFGVPDLKNALNSGSARMNLPDKKIFALVGPVCYRKGQDVLARAVEQLPEKVRKDCSFLFVGKNTEPWITDVVINVQKKFPENILYLDEIKYDDLCRLYYDIDCLICTSRDDPGPAVVGESMSLGKPSICSEHTSAAAVIEQYHAGYVYRHNSSGELARRIVAAFGLSRDQYEEMSKNARRAYEQEYSEQVFEKKLNKCMERI